MGAGALIHRRKSAPKKEKRMDRLALERRMYARERHLASAAWGQVRYNPADPPPAVVAGASSPSDVSVDSLGQDAPATGRRSCGPPIPRGLPDPWSTSARPRKSHCESDSSPLENPRSTQRTSAVGVHQRRERLLRTLRPATPTGVLLLGNETTLTRSTSIIGHRGKGKSLKKVGCLGILLLEFFVLLEGMRLAGAI